MFNATLHALSSIRHSSLTVLYLIYVWALPSFFSLSLFCDQVLIASFSCCTDTFSWFLIRESWCLCRCGIALVCWTLCMIECTFAELMFPAPFEVVYFQQWPCRKTVCASWVFGFNCFLEIEDVVGKELNTLHYFSASI